ncbi:hypothetical protein KIN20_016649 [Parelaphostrongylus tenuis]|uniref:Uncharacterized protein n=1 Tax=Parelaphostrongylus tenuis TaxID=148309 RepID=A0AAD5N1L3_PARTN|nr:hypothetical protein KIN20_016649 [Parelaphostrongylus tenuis]
MPQGQAHARSFTVSCFTLPVFMVYSRETDVRCEDFWHYRKKDAAMGFVSRLVIREFVFDVLEQQGRIAFLPDEIISNILGQVKLQTDQL